MWSEKSAPLHLDLRRSPRLVLLICMCHGGAAALAAVLPVPAWTVGALAAAVLVSATAAVARHALQLHPRAVRAVISRDAGEWLLVDCDGLCRRASLSSDSYVHPWITILNFTGGRRCTVLVLPDRVDREAYRRLRVRLRLYGS